MAATAHPPPPPPPPLSPSPPSVVVKSKAGLKHPPPPGQAAMPFFSDEDYPVQETSPTPEAQSGTQAAASLPLLTTQSHIGLYPPQANIAFDPDEECCPVQETDPTPQQVNQVQISEQEEFELPGATAAIGTQDEEAIEGDSPGFSQDQSRGERINGPETT